VGLNFHPGFKYLSSSSSTVSLSIGPEDGAFRSKTASNTLSGLFWFSACAAAGPVASTTSSIRYRRNLLNLKILVVPSV
jgi:hypothetical protein